MVFDDKTPEGCAVASSATLLSIKSRPFNMRYAYNNMPQYGGVYSTANFRGLLSVSSLTNYMKKFDSGFTNITGSSMAEIQSVVKSGHTVLYYGFSSYETYFRDKHHAKVIAGYKNGRFLVYDPCYYSAGSGSSHRNAYDYGAIAWVPVSTVARESTGGSNNGTIMITNRLYSKRVRDFPRTL
ncbi:C39 family peptidase, partial [Lactobacillus delbrueckii subsp. allosunkii]|uniref:C39 family peptidase n=1 Tax=Lactobacillus delbrueckii TaxID=1584 RepID=UPI003A8AFF7A